LIAGNPPERRVEKLRDFWESVTTPPFGAPDVTWLEIKGEFAHSLVNRARSLGTLLGGAPGFFAPRVPPPYLQPSGSVEAISYYDVTPLKGDARTTCGFRSDQCRRNALQCRRRQCPHGQFCLF